MVELQQQLIIFALLGIVLGGFAEGTFSLGVNYGTLASNLPAPEEVVKLVKSTTITKVKLYNADASLLHAFANTGISIVVGIPNDQLQNLATNPTTAAIWVKQNIAAFEPQTKIVGIAVGNEVLTTNNGTFSTLLMPCINNLHTALVSLGLQSVQISSPHSFSILAMSYPPSSGSFRQDYLHVIRPLLDFLSSTGAPLMMNAYPYFAYHNDPTHVALDYALFNGHVITDSRTKLRYSNLFDAQVDATYAAMQQLGFRDVAVVVSETGWPSRGGSDEPAANYSNALTYNKNLILHVASGVGTPMRPKSSVDVYLFALFNENLKPGPLSEKNYGLFDVDGSMVYDIGIRTGGSPSGPSSPSRGGSPSQAPPQQVNHVWCIAKPNAEDSVLLKGINFACGEGSADCVAIQKGGGCYNPATMNSHASYAFNAYYQKHGRNFWNCYFSGAGMLSITDPSYGSCKYTAT